eukprot:g1570.t1
MVIALLHDVLDHKFSDVDDDTFQNFLRTLYDKDPEIIEWVLKVIECISFSKEKRRGMRYYEDELKRNAEWIFRRNVVSDADKLEALGAVGAARCFATQKHFAEVAKENFNIDRLLDGVVQHCHDKLFILSSRYMRTETGRSLAKGREDELRKVLIAHGVQPKELSPRPKKDVQ